jgi:hypothetical protein
LSAGNNRNHGSLPNEQRIQFCYEIALGCSLLSGNVLIGSSLESGHPARLGNHRLTI